VVRVQAESERGGVARLIVALSASVVASGAFTLAQASSTFSGVVMCVPLAAAAGLLFAAIVARPDLGIALLLLVLPFQSFSPQMTGGPLTTIQPSAVLMPIVVVAVALRAVITRDLQLTWTPLARLVMVFAAAMIVLVAVRTLAFRPPEELSSVNIKTVGRFVMGTVLFFLIARFATTPRRLNALVIAFSIGAAVATAVGIAQYFFGMHIAAMVAKEVHLTEFAGATVIRANSTLGNPHTFAFLACIMVLLCVALILDERSPARRFALLGAAVFFAVGLFTTQARAGLVMTLVGVCVILLRRRKYGYLGGIAFAAAAFQIAAIAFPGLGGRFGGTFSAGGPDASTTMRFSIYQEALSEIENNPLIGTGLIYMRMEKPGRPWTAHNSFLDIWIAGGIVLLGLFVALFWAAIREMWVKSVPSGYDLSTYALWLLASLCGTAVFLMLDILENDYYRPLTFYALLGFVAVVSRQARRLTLGAGQ